MWIRKSPSEVNLEKRDRLLRATSLDVLLGVGLWYGLVRFFMFSGLLPQHPISGYIGCVVIAVILPATWLSNWHKRARTTVCDRCNTLKTADDQPNCNCGGRYLTLREMKWINSAPSGRTFEMRAESHLVTSHAPLKLIRSST
jgi:hypothetical protein